MNRAIRLSWTILLVSFFLLAACSSPEEKRNTFMENGKKFEQQGDLVKARLEYKNAVQVDPKCVECLRYLGRVELALKNLRGAYAAYVKASELSPEDTDIKIDLGRILIMGHAAKQAEETAKSILAKDPGNIDAKVILAISYAQQKGMHRQALDNLEELRKEHPHREEGYLLAARMLMADNKGEQAETILKSALSHLENKGPVYNTLMKLYVSERQWDNAIKYAKLYYASPPKGMPASAPHITLAQLYEQKGDVEAAAKEWKSALDTAKDKSELVIPYAKFLIRQKSIEDAEQLLRKHLATHQDNLKLRIALADLLASTKRGEEAIKLIKEAYSDDLEKPARLTLLDEEAKINFSLGRFQKTLTITEEVLKENPNDLPALTLQAKIALVKRDGEEAVNILRRLVEEEPDNIDYKLFLAQAHAINGEYKLAEEQVRTVLKKHPDSLKGWQALIKLKLAEKDLEGASSAVSEALGHLPTSAPLYNIDGLILWMAHDIQGAEKRFRKAIELAPEWLIPYKNLATLKLQAGESEEAEKTFMEAANRYPSAPGPKILLATLYEQSGRAAKAKDIYEELLKQHPDSTILMNNLAFLIADTDSSPAQLQRARKLIDRALESHMPPPPTFLDTKAWIEFKSGNLESALEIINQALSAEPDNPTLLYHEAVILSAMNKKEEAIAAVKKAIEQGENHFPEKGKALDLLKSLEQ